MELYLSYILLSDNDNIYLTQLLKIRIYFINNFRMMSSNVFGFFLVDKGVYIFFSLILDSSEPIIDDDERTYHDAGIR